ncbi:MULTISPECIES: mannose-1-phosphate guanylyltransferase/mannose-6-phosphate isomerase [unclassified Marinobacterium]|uniref:mannose-1-phosphate guanylyltransferase/mannose-6-phosphate isomerase n=1 Tax=unclassified Marinobacterium TaxID=2644139 RepID=UPI001569491B|nr:MULTISPECIES: mannose-1-phosphate guanylyltransferase/mannose-6-phosphate isomerase [unclassified Marinobacterium]NRP56644.1 Mannose-1-phosphate guanylyltransferase 1 [Marinobacterium sp. xm-d-510]NRP96567.1 Mannose-1-phosphate guanylyltransferase 1 [Marinobacterium sp. xm-a-127]
MSVIKTVVMAGGSGSRLWPLSRSLYPKQFLPLAAEQTMLQATLSRVKGLSGSEAMLICNEEHRFIAAEQIRQLGVKAEILLEPVGRNTAPAIALAALEATAKGDDPLLLVLAADHVIQNEAEFRSVVSRAQPLAEAGSLVTFGIVATGPETGYGYIRRGTEQGDGYTVAEFVEKPDLELATSYVASGEYYWNSGMFLFKASRYLEELEKFRPDILEACKQALSETKPDMDFVRINEHAFAACPDESVDYAVMEKTDSAVVVPLDAGWSDVGAWSSLWEVTDKDTDGNAVRGDVMTYYTQDCLIHSTNKLVATVGLKDVVIVETKDAVLVADKNQVQDVKKIVEQLKAEGRTEHQLHREVYRPWGKYDSIDNGERYQVKRITVKPGAKLSVQMHHHRSEHWIVVSGTATVRRDDEEMLVTENESVYLPVGSVHSLHNPGKIPLELIEVQSGPYLSEDDILRFEDIYGRE